MNAPAPDPARPLVSVVTPAYNALPYLVETIRSVQAQDYPAVEHIVVDGASTDGTPRVLEAIPHLVWVSEPDGGQSQALNKGFRLARGEIIGWLNADDVYRPGAVTAAVDTLAQHAGVDLVYGDLQVVDEAGCPIGVTRSQPFNLKALLFNNFIKQPTVFMRRRVIDTLGGVDERLHYVMDRELWLRAGRRFNMMYLPGWIPADFRLCQGTKSYDQAALFGEEWQQVLQQAFQDPAFGDMPPSVRRRALRENGAAYRMALMLRAADQRLRLDLLGHFFGALRQNPKLVLNRGAWLFMVQGLLGMKVDKLGRFSKSRFGF